MPVQFPNFLGVPIQKTDYSGIGDVFQNYYAGKAMPKDDLIKAVQAEFARPKAEQDLLSTKLSNRKSQIEINKTIQELRQQKMFEDMLKNALVGGNGVAVPQQPIASSGVAQMPAERPIMPSGMTMANAPAQMMTNINPALGQALTQSMNQTQTQPAIPQQSAAPILSAGMTPMQSAPDATMQQSAPQESVEKPNEITVSKGSPHLAGIDMLYETNPLSRAFLEKKGFKKKQDIKFDQKSGRTTILTQYPSGKVTVQTVGGAGGGTGEAPLTMANVTANQKIVSAIDNTLPVIDRILDLDKSTPKKSQWEPYPRTGDPGLFGSWGLGSLPGYKSAATNYESLVSSGVDTLLAAYGLPKTNEGIETVKKQLLIGHGETDAAYKKRLRELKEDLIRRKSYSSTLLNKTISNPPLDAGSNSANDYSDLDKYDDSSGDQ